jgi:hypothetical protein
VFIIFILAFSWLLLRSRRKLNCSEGGRPLGSSVVERDRQTDSLIKFVYDSLGDSRERSVPAMMPPQRPSQTFGSIFHGQV